MSLIEKSKNIKENLIIDLPVDNVIFDESMLVNSPSRNEGCLLEDEIKLRIIGCERIQHAGRLLQLPQVNKITKILYSLLLQLLKFYYKDFI